MTSQPDIAPMSVRELLQRYPPGRVTGWDPANPPAVERGFRLGYLTGARRFVESRAFGFVHDEPGDMELAANLNDHLHELRAKLYDNDHWTDRRAALLRGCQHGLLDAVRARAAGVSVTRLVVWLDDLGKWTGENPIRLDWEHARPPDAPEPDCPPLGRDDTPRRLWSEVFGMWVMFEPRPDLPVRERGPFIESREQFERMQADAGAQPLGNIERLLHPDPAVRHAPTAQKLSPVLVCVADVQPELVRWLWPGRIALGKLTLLCGDPGLGKSFITLDLAARTSTGLAWPDMPLLKASPSGVVLLSAEDDLADTIRPRLDAAGADVGRVESLQAVRRLCFDGKTEDTYFDLTQDLPALEAAIQKTSECRLVVIDPLTAYLGKIDGHKNAEVRAILARLFELAAKHKVAVLAVTHLNKASTLPAIYRAMGSLAFVAAARAVWAVVRDEDDESGRRRLFVPVKNNLGADETGLAYALEPVGQTARVRWESDPVNIRADAALDGGGRKAKVQHDARQFVIDTIKANGGDMLSDDVSAAAEAEGISERTLRRAKKAVADSYKEKGRGGRWRCKLKGGHEDGLDTDCPS